MRYPATNSEVTGPISRQSPMPQHHGQIRAELPVPPMDAAAAPGVMGAYCPCGSAVDEERFGGSGDIWVADGYGSSLVHRFDKQGHHLSALTGEEGGGRFVSTHAAFIDRRTHKTPELYIADRENKTTTEISASPNGSLVGATRSSLCGHNALPHTEPRLLAGICLRGIHHFPHLDDEIVPKSKEDVVLSVVDIPVGS
jgi:hypothetical protein